MLIRLLLLLLPLLLLFITFPVIWDERINGDCGEESVDSCTGLYMIDDDSGDDAEDMEENADNGITEGVQFILLLPWLLFWLLILLVLLFMINAGLSWTCIGVWNGDMGCEYNGCNWVPNDCEGSEGGGGGGNEEEEEEVCGGGGSRGIVELDWR